MKAWRMLVIQSTNPTATPTATTISRASQARNEENHTKSTRYITFPAIASTFSRRRFVLA
jgi:hypothetical protein